MIVLDTTVLVYATGVDHPLRAPCRRVVDAVANGQLRATTTVEVIQEFTHVRGRRQDRLEAGPLAGMLTDLLAPLLAVDERALRRGLEVYSRSTRLGAFDAVLAAAALEAGSTALVSADSAFAEVPGLAHVVPSDAAVELLIGSV